MTLIVRGEGPFADAVRRALEYAQSRGVDLSGVEVEVVSDPSITDAGAYTEHLGDLRFRIRYNPRYSGDKVLASHEAGHVAKWAWEYKKRGGMQYNPNIDEPLAEAFGSVVARSLYSWPVTFKGAPLNLTKVLPPHTTYITVTVDGKPIVVKMPEWSGNMERYRAGILLSPYFYNVTNWSHVFGNVTAMPGDVIETIHKAWQSGAVEVVPGWGGVWRTTPTWTWAPTSQTTSNKNQATAHQTTQTTATTAITTTTTGDNAKTGSTPQVTNTATNSSAVQPKVVPTQPAVDVPLPPSDVQPPRYFSSDIAPSPAAQEWSSYISGRRVQVVFRNWPFLDTATLKETRKDHVAGVGVVSGDRLRFEGKIPVPRVVDPNAWIELVDEKTGKVLARLRSDELYKLTTEGAPVALYWSHVAVEEKWPGWERFVDRAKELDEKLGTWRPSGVVAPPPGTQQPSNRGVVINPDGTVSAVRVANAPTEYVPPKVPDDVRKQFENLLSELKKLGEGVNLKNVGEVHNRFIQLRDKALDIARAHPQLIDEVNKAAERVGSAVREASDKLYSALAKAAGRDSFWKGEGDVKTPIGVYKYDPATGAFLLSLYDRPTAENIVGFIKDDGTPVVIKKTQNMSEALEEYNKIRSKTPDEKAYEKLAKYLQNKTDLPQSNTHNKIDIPATVAGFVQSVGDAVRDAVGFLADAIKTGASVVLTAVGDAKPSPSAQPSGEQQFVATTPQTAGIRNRRRDAPSKSSSSGYRPADYLASQHSEFVQLPGQKIAVKTGGGFVPPSIPAAETDGFVAVKPARPPDYVLAVEAARRAAETHSSTPSNTSTTSSGYRPADYLVNQQSASSAASPPSIQLAETSSQTSSAKRYRGRPVATAI